MNKQAIIMLCRASRKAQHMTLKRLSDSCDVSVSALSRFERGKFNMDFVNVYYNTVLNNAERSTCAELFLQKGENDEC